MKFQFLFLAYSAVTGWHDNLHAIDSIPKKTIIDSAIVIKQALGESLRVIEIDKGWNWGIIVSVLALIVSGVAIWYPTYQNKLLERRSNFFKFYEYWNNADMLQFRKKFWVVAKTPNMPIGKVDLLLLKQRKIDDYFLFENICDVLTDIAALYNDNLIDKKLVKSLMSTFIVSYGCALDTYFEFRDTNEPSEIKLSGKHFEPLINLAKEFDPSRFPNM